MQPSETRWRAPPEDLGLNLSPPVRLDLWALLLALGIVVGTIAPPLAVAFVLASAVVSAGTPFAKASSPKIGGRWRCFRRCSSRAGLGWRCCTRRPPTLCASSRRWNRARSWWSDASPRHLYRRASATARTCASNTYGTRTKRSCAAGASRSTRATFPSALGFSFYVSNFGSYSATYGAVASVIVLLLYFSISAAILLFGAEINAEAYRVAEEKEA